MQQVYKTNLSVTFSLTGDGQRYRTIPRPSQNHPGSSDLSSTQLTFPLQLDALWCKECDTQKS
jgi:hypothetical protein